MSEVDRIIDELQREFSGDPWHGSPLLQILDGLSADQAAAHPVQGAHSIWELVLHITAWKGEVRRRLSGAPAGEPEEGDWPAVGDTAPERWWRALEGLRGAHERLIAAIRELPEDTLFEPTNDPRNRPLGAGVSYYVLLHGIVQHDVYHSGQIALLKRALES
jgi:uncharacterized damage-inducible protein DinB